MSQDVFPIWKHGVKSDVSRSQGAERLHVSQNETVSTPETPNWYLREWMNHFGKRQANLVSELDWNRARASKVYNGVNEYRREVVNELAAWLGIEPHELLMPPERALAIRQLYATAETIIAGADRFLPPAVTPRPARKTGTAG